MTITADTRPTTTVTATVVDIATRRRTAAASLSPTRPAPYRDITADHKVSIAAAARHLGTVRPLREATIRRYLTAGKLQRLDDGVSAHSVSAYEKQRDANKARTRFKPAETYAAPVDPIHAAIAEAKAAQLEAAELEKRVKELRARVKELMEPIGAGRHGVWEAELTPGRMIDDKAAIDAHFKEIEKEKPKKQSAGSWKITRVA